jgi:hypothetical protein
MPESYYKAYRANFRFWLFMFGTACVGKVYGAPVNLLVFMALYGAGWLVCMAVIFVVQLVDRNNESAFYDN